MSKSPISFTPEASPISSPLTPKTFDFPPPSLQEAGDELEQQGEIAQQRALTKEEEEEKLLKQAALESSLNEYLIKLESAPVINEDYWDYLKECINIIKDNSVEYNFINRFAKLAPKLQNTGMIIKEFYDFIFGLNNSTSLEFLSQVITDLPEISEKSPNAKAYFFELLSKPQNINKLNLKFCAQIINILPAIGNDELAEEIDRNLKEHLKDKLHTELFNNDFSNMFVHGRFMSSFISLSKQSENDNFIKFLLTEITKDENFVLLEGLDTNDKDEIFELCAKFIQDLPLIKALEKIKLQADLKNLQDFLKYYNLFMLLEFDEALKDLKLDEDFKYLMSLKIGQNKDIELEKWEKIFSLIEKKSKKLDFLQSISSGEEINFFLYKNPSFLDFFKGEIIPVEIQLKIEKLYKTGAINKDQYEKFLKDLKETLTAKGKTEALSEVLDATLDLKSFDKPEKLAVIDSIIYELFDKSISYPAALKKTLIKNPDGSEAYTDSILTQIAGYLQKFIDVYPLAKTILKTAQLEGFVGISNSPADPNNSNVEGCYKPATKDVIIGESYDSSNIINTVSTIIHELTHKYMFQNVNKEGLPFKEDNSEAEKLFKTILNTLKIENDVLHQCYQYYPEFQYIAESIAYFFQKNSLNTYYSKVTILEKRNSTLSECFKKSGISQEVPEENPPYAGLDRSGIYQAAVEKYLLPIMHGFDIIFEKLSHIFSSTSKPTGIVLDYLSGDYDVSLLEAMEFITLELDPEITHTITDTITDYLGADWQQADLVD
ncbi:MAG: hypothetical protein J0M23_05720 [Rickettsiales bacterium]|nr:hypothetical protein [Rickettsiales bacterium]